MVKGEVKWKNTRTRVEEHYQKDVSYNKIAQYALPYLPYQLDRLASDKVIQRKQIIEEA